ncbi:MAG TPA: nucleoside kinase [bacterium (Candidatus Stahlbacteria)]|nr:nucleoside kinase [Candidatus Stahlbacteria bacterium]
MEYDLEQGLIFIMLKAFFDLHPDLRIIIDHSYGPGVYCRYSDEDRRIDLIAVRKRMREIMDAKAKIEILRLNRSQFRRRFSHRDDLLGLLQSKKRVYTCYRLGNYLDHMISPLSIQFDKISDFEIESYPPGFVLSWGEFVSRPRLFRMIQEYEEWGQILGVYDVGRLNKAIVERFEQLILLAEALHEKKIAYIADRIIKERKRLILVAGPSASGKTTFSKRLAIQLLASGISPVAISIDDFFLPRDQTPYGPDGCRDFECLEALNIELLSRDLQLLLSGEPVNLPKFNFHTGRPEYRKRVERLSEKDVLILEGIHGLNDQLTYTIDPEVKFKIYASAITQLNIDDHNRIHTRDTRLIRRMVRDVQFRDHPATETIGLWTNVVKGEDKYIFPFQEEADVMFNSALIYELPVLAYFARRLLKRIKRSDPSYDEAQRLYDLLSYFCSVRAEPVPDNSILREFIGGSIYDY